MQSKFGTPDTSLNILLMDYKAPPARTNIQLRMYREALFPRDPAGDVVSHEFTTYYTDEGDLLHSVVERGIQRMCVSEKGE